MGIKQIWAPIFVLFTATAMATGCGSDSDDSSGGSTSGGGSCTTTSDCDGNSVCIQAGSAGGGCVVQCSASANECGGSGSCQGVGSLEVNTCQTEPDPMAAPEPEEEPRIPCETDAECDALQSGAICVQFMGHKDCTIPCASESACDTPSAGGVAVDFLQCAADEADDSRMGCVPDPACFSNPVSCVTVPGL